MTKLLTTRNDTDHDMDVDSFLEYGYCRKLSRAYQEHIPVEQ